MFTSEVRLG